jgi:hypothetical protein
VVLMALLLVAGAFYWYELRPSFARRGCAAFIRQAVQSSSSANVDTVRVGYELCLAREGVRSALER